MCFGHPVGQFANSQRVGNDHVADLLNLRLLVLAPAGLFPLAILTALRGGGRARVHEKKEVK